MYDIGLVPPTPVVHDGMGWIIDPECIWSMAFLYILHQNTSWKFEFGSYTIISVQWFDTELGIAMNIAAWTDRFVE